LDEQGNLEAWMNNITKHNSIPLCISPNIHPTLNGKGGLAAFPLNVGWIWVEQITKWGRVL